VSTTAHDTGTSRGPENIPTTTDAEPGKFSKGRSGLVLPLLLTAFSTYMLYGILIMKVPEGTDFPGPQVFPGVLMVAGYVLAALLVIHYLRSPEHVVETSGRSWRSYSDWSALAWIVGGFTIFALTIELLGWILAAALLFWAVARGIGSRRHLFDASLALTLSSVVYLAFDAGLGLNLPSGILGGF
jgi:putative tricarboxylic transport membrane protein